MAELRLPPANGKLYIAMVGLPAKGKSMVAAKLKDALEKEGAAVKVFNNGEVRRRLFPENTTHADFYDPDNMRNAAIRDEIALINIYDAKNYLKGGGQVAVLDATNVSRDRRRKIICHLTDYPVLFVECVNDDRDLYEASIARKIKLPEFSSMGPEAAFKSFQDRISYYKKVYRPLKDEDNFLIIDSLNNRILREELNRDLPYYPVIRDLLVSDWVKNLFLLRHGQTFFNLENRLGGDSELTERGWDQARRLAEKFKNVKIPYLFTSRNRRTRQTAVPLLAGRDECRSIELSEFNEINAGVCEGMTYDEIKRDMPEIHALRKADKYNYVYPRGEGYSTLKDRVSRGIKKALYLSGNADTIMIIGHQAVNRMILSHFHFRRTEDTPYIYIPQERYFHIVSTQSKKLYAWHSF